MTGGKQPGAAQREGGGRAWVFHPLLLGVFFVLVFYSASMRRFPLGVVWFPLAAVAAGILVLWGALALLTRDTRKSGVLASLVATMVLAYGYLAEPIKAAGGISLRRWGLQGGTNYVLLPAWSLILLVGVWLVARTRRSLRTATTLLNILAGCVLLTTVCTIAIYTLRSRAAWRGSAEFASINPPATEALPSICYILVDGYGRADVLKEIYGHDNGPFLQSLRDRGFYVAAEAHANYCQTSLSQASTLNMKYLDELAEQLGRDSRDYAPLAYWVRRSTVGRTLRRCGYKMVVFDSGWAATSKLDGAVVRGVRWRLNEFELSFINYTMAGPVLSRLRQVPSGYDFHRRTILYTLDGIPDALRSDGPVFVYAHVLCPHPPFVFAADGGARTPSYPYSLVDGNAVVDRLITVQEYKTGYRDQLRFLNRKLDALMARILAEAKRPTIVLVQADHGPGALLNWNDLRKADARERLGILSAYLFPDRDYSALRPDISPVNTFRILFNQYFGGKYPVASDRCYLSDTDRPYLFHDVTERVRKARSPATARVGP